MAQPSHHREDDDRLRERAAKALAALPLSGHNAVAVYRDLNAARAAVDALERGGIDAVHVSLLGPGVEEAARRADMRDRDERVARHVGARVGTGAAAGAAVGGAAGFLGGLLAFAIPGIGPVVGAGVWAATAAGGIAGGTMGGVVAGVSSFDMTPAWELTSQSVRQGRVVVGVHTDDAGLLDRALHILDETRATSVERFDARGRRVEDG